MSRLTILLTLGLLSAVLLGCSPQADPTSLSGSQNAVALASQLPPLPAAHSASVLMSFTVQGMQTSMRDLNAVDEGTALRLASSSNTISWGVWGFANAEAATECVVDFNGDAGAGAYFALSDYDKGKWEIAGPVTGPQALLTISDPRYSNASGELYIAIFAWDGASVLVDQLALTADIAPINYAVEFSGGYTSIAQVYGAPAISFYDDVAGDLCYVRSASLFGASWGLKQILDSAGDTGQYTSLKVVDGNPAIAYYDVTAKLLRYIRAIDVEGMFWATPVTVASPLTVGESCSLAVIAGNPAISYYDFDAGDLRFVRALDATGAAWGAPVTPDANGNTGFASSLEEVGGFAAISYRNGSSGQLWYVRAGDAAGTLWNMPVLIDGNNNAGYYSSLELVSGIPAVCYYASTMGDLMYVIASDAVGATWNAPLQLDGAEDEGSYCSLAVVGGVPAISYHGGLQGDLRYIKAQDALGSSWNPAVMLDESSVITGRDTSLCDVYGMPAISYFDHSNGVLRYAWGF